MKLQNFKIWRGRLPHWRADSITYYATFRYRRDLDDDERRVLYAHLLRQQGRRWELLVLCVLPDRAEMMFTMHQGPSGEEYELSKLIEAAKNKAAKQIQKKTGEKYPPFYAESFDRIIRDQAEFDERVKAITQSTLDFVDEGEEYDTLWLMLPEEAPAFPEA